MALLSHSGSEITDGTSGTSGGSGPCGDLDQQTASPGVDSSHSGDLPWSSSLGEKSSWSSVRCLRGKDTWEGTL